MKVNMLALTISNLHGGRFIPEALAANIATLRDQVDDTVKIRETIENKTMVEHISIDGEPIRLLPAIVLINGTVSRTFKTSRHTHTLEFTANFSTGVVSSSLKSILNSTGEEVELSGMWRITNVTTNYNRKPRRPIEPVRKIDWVEETRKLIELTGGRYSRLTIN